MPKTFEQCKEKYPADELWIEKFRDIELVCRWPNPDAFDSAFGDIMAFRTHGDGAKMTRGCETLIKACCVSHSAEELDAIRRREMPKNLPLFVRVGRQLFEKLAPEAEEKGKD